MALYKFRIIIIIIDITGNVRELSKSVPPVDSRNQFSMTK